MATFRVLENTPVRFVNTYYSTALPTYYNRLYKDWDFTNRLFEPYEHEFDTTDPMFFQFRTDYNVGSIEIKVFSMDNVEASGITFITPVQNFGDLGILYNCEVDISALDGCYYMTIKVEESGKKILNFTSEPFSVVTGSTKMKLEWYGSDALNDPFQWGDNRATMRIEGQDKDPVIESEKIDYIDTDGNIVNTYGRPENARLLQVRLVPEWILRRLNLMLKHDEFYVNGIQYGANELFELTETQNNTYPCSVTIRETNYWNFTTDPEEDGELAPVPTLAIFAETGKALFADTEKGIGQY